MGTLQPGDQEAGKMVQALLGKDIWGQPLEKQGDISNLQTSALKA